MSGRSIVRPAWMTTILLLPIIHLILGPRIGATTAKTTAAIGEMMVETTTFHTSCHVVEERGIATWIARFGKLTEALMTALTMVPTRKRWKATLEPVIEDLTANRRATPWKEFDNGYCWNSLSLTFPTVPDEPPIMRDSHLLPTLTHLRC